MPGKMTYIICLTYTTSTSATVMTAFGADQHHYILNCTLRNCFHMLISAICSAGKHWGARQRPRRSWRIRQVKSVQNLHMHIMQPVQTVSNPSLRQHQMPESNAYGLKLGIWLKTRFDLVTTAMMRDCCHGTDQTLHVFMHMSSAYIRVISCLVLQDSSVEAAGACHIK